jgi:hypothetical protein
MNIYSLGIHGQLSFILIIYRQACELMDHCNQRQGELRVMSGISLTLFEE